MAKTTRSAVTTDEGTDSPRLIASKTGDTDSMSDMVALKSENGKTLVAEEVVAKIAGLAVREVEGVHELVAFGAGQTLTSLAKTITREDMKDLGVRVEVGTVEAAVDVRIIANYGASIPRVAEGIRKNVTEKIKHMTGLRTKEVNIEVLDLWFPESAVPVEERPARQLQ